MSKLAQILRNKSRYKKPVELANIPKPQQGMQERFYSSDVDIVLAGSGAGTGKTLALLLLHTRWIHNSEYKGTIFRRTFSQITNTGSLLDESFKIYPLFGGEFNQQKMRWKFPSGATIDFRHLQHEKSKYEHQGSQISGLCFDELTHLSETQFFYLLSRNRSVSGVKPFVRATCNPDADSWVAKLVQWYLDDRGYPNEDKIGIVRYFVNRENELIWSDNKEELIEKYGNVVKSFTFLPGTIYENKKLIEVNPEYLANLENLHPVERERLLKGNWKIKYEAGTIFDRSWFDIIDEQFTYEDLTMATVVRFWDFAATEKEQAKSGTSYTVGAKIAKFSEDFYIIVDIIYVQIKGGEIQDLIQSVAKQDGQHCAVRWELEGGSSGKIVAQQYQELLGKFHPNCEAVKPLGNKMTRALPFATASKNGKIKLIRASWNDQFLNACQDFDGTHKPLTNDIVDACDGAFSELENIPVYFTPLFGVEKS